MPFSLDPQWVIRAEQTLGVKLPPAYVAKMLQANGGSIEIADEEWQLHPILDETDAKRVARTCNDIIRETGQAREWDGFPPGALSIGSSSSGDHLVLLPTGGGRYDDTLHLWVHETHEVIAIAPATEVFLTR
jgi:hypothetical protein